MSTETEILQAEFMARVYPASEYLSKYYMKVQNLWEAYLMRKGDAVLDAHINHCPVDKLMGEDEETVE